uniref:Uncharacterized protein n=1 Tax=Globodera rostochiensis TaxID=31243 RepID=A0A914HUS6_GLORO
MEFWILILVSIFATNLLDKAESVQLEELEELPLQTFDELFVDEWLDKDEAEDLKTPAPTNFGQNVHHQIDRQNTQIGQIELNSTDQIGQIEPNSTDQNPPLTESDHSDNAKNGEEQNEVSLNENIAENERKRKIIDEFLAIKDEFKQKAKFSSKEWTHIEVKIANHLKVNRKKIYEWKKEFGLTHNFYAKEQRKHLVEYFDQKKAELKRDGFKNSYPTKINETVAKELGITDRTIYNWKRKLGQTASKHIYAHSEQKELMKSYYEIKNQNPKFRDEDIAKTIKIGTRTLYKWKKQFKRQQFHPNSVDGHSVEGNAAANVQEIGNSNSGII